MSNINKAFTQPITQIIDNKTGEILSQAQEKQILLQLSNDVKNITALAEWTLKNDTQLLTDINNYNGKQVKNSKLGEYLGVKLPKELKVKTTGNSRYEYIYQDKTITEAKSWLERLKAHNGTSTKYVTQGWKRTANPNRPQSLKPKINLAAGAGQYAKIINNPFQERKIELALVINQKWYILIFNFDNERFQNAQKITLPSVRVNQETGLPIFDFSAEYDYPYIEFSSDYIVGIDVGITNYATVSVINVKTKQIVYSTTLSQRVHSLHNSVNATSKEIKYLQIKQDNLFRNNQKNRARRLYSEIANQRRALKNKRKELAIIAAQEIAELSYVYDNALVVIEDLSHIKNTMKFGRWNRGMLKHWLKHFVEQNGGRMFSVNAAYTSQNCYKCSERGSFKDYHTFYCKNCDLIIDRDINAAVNIALRILPDIHSKSCTTRKKAKKLKKKQLPMVTPKTKQSLKYPGRDRTKNKPTPKRLKQGVKTPKNKRSVTNNNNIQMVITGETAQRPLKTLKKQHDYVNKYQKILKT